MGIDNRILRILRWNEAPAAVTVAFVWDLPIELPGT